MADPLQPLYRLLDLLLQRGRVGFLAWFRHGQQELAHGPGEFLPFIVVCFAKFEHLRQRHLGGRYRQQMTDLQLRAAPVPQIGPQRCEGDLIGGRRVGERDHPPL